MFVFFVFVFGLWVIRCLVCDLGSLESVAGFAAALRSVVQTPGAPPLAVLVNNAGLVGPNAVQVNHLGHFALTL